MIDGVKRRKIKLAEQRSGARRNYLLKPGEAGAMAKAASTIEHGIRGDKYGKPEGCWSRDAGLLNQVINLWS